MKDFIKIDPWNITVDSFDQTLHPIVESLMSLGNGRMGQRANFPETYSGESLHGNYIAGVYYPDKTRVGWWKNGYPEYFAKVLNAVSWIDIQILINGIEIDLAKIKLDRYERRLNMKEGILYRTLSFKTSEGIEVTIQNERFYSIVNQENCFLQYMVSASKECEIEIIPSVNFNVKNSDANYDEDFWFNRDQGHRDALQWVSAQTKKTNFEVVTVVENNLSIDNNKKIPSAKEEISEGLVKQFYKLTLQPNSPLRLVKFVSTTSSFYHTDKSSALKQAIKNVKDCLDYTTVKNAHIKAWSDRWNQCDIEIIGDAKAQQGIRFNIFQLYQTYSGEDARLNIGPKGFTGEKYGGSTYWDTEAYCLPFYMCTTDHKVARNLLVYRYKHLQKAIENAQKLGFENGAALYPMVTINGEECHNEWEITFEEIHRNGAIAYAIKNYTEYTGDTTHLYGDGIEVLIGISRFWAQRVHLSPQLNQYVMMGVTGPNEYENNVDNNWYTNYIARWCLSYTKHHIEQFKTTQPEHWIARSEKVDFEYEELNHWQDIIDRIYLPVDQTKGIFLQQDGFLNKENVTVADLKESDQPLNQNWSWDRILRSPYIKQADVLQGLYFFSEDFTDEEVSNNFSFYEPRTVHESSLSPCVHSILAARLGLHEKAYEMYLRTARLDLDDYNNDSEDGCHITSMAGTWMSIIEGFAGMKVKNNELHFNTYLPKQWDGYSFKINFRGQLLEISVNEKGTEFVNHSNQDIHVTLNGKRKKLPA